MAQTGQPGGRQTLENNRVIGDIHKMPPASGNAKSQSPADTGQSGSSNRNVTSTQPKPPQVA